MIDSEGYRANVGIVLINDQSQVFWARRITQDGWQFPQGGVDEGELPIDGMYRELYEEIGLVHNDVSLLATTPSWLRYQLPRKFQRRHSKPLCIGQKQAWFLLRLNSEDKHIELNACDKPEFDEWRWVDYWYPMDHVVYFKKNVYEQALKNLAPFLKHSE